MDFHPYNPQYSDYIHWNALVGEGMYKVVTPSSMSGLMPQALLNKVQPSLVMVLASGNCTIVVVNLNRVDTPKSAIDQQPYIAVFDHHTSEVFAGFIDHGNWPDRTTYQNQAFFNHISLSGTGAYYPLSQMPLVQSGLLEEMPIPSQEQAFGNAFQLGRLLRNDRNGLLISSTILNRFSRRSLRWHSVPSDICREQQPTSAGTESLVAESNMLRVTIRRLASGVKSQKL